MAAFELVKNNYFVNQYTTTSWQIGEKIFEFVANQKSGVNYWAIDIESILVITDHNMNNFIKLYNFTFFMSYGHLNVCPLF